MWFPRANSSGDLSCEVKKSQEQLAALGTVSTKEAVQNIFNSTHCYDLMQNSTKVVVFETQIPFQLAFYALVEHGKLSNFYCALLHCIILHSHYDRLFLLHSFIHSFIHSFLACFLALFQILRLLHYGIQRRRLSLHS